MCKPYDSLMISLCLVPCSIGSIVTPQIEIFFIDIELAVLLSWTLLGQLCFLKVVTYVFKLGECLILWFELFCSAKSHSSSCFPSLRSALKNPELPSVLCFLDWISIFRIYEYLLFVALKVLCLKVFKRQQVPNIVNTLYYQKYWDLSWLQCPIWISRTPTLNPLGLTWCRSTPLSFNSVNSSKKAAHKV